MVRMFERVGYQTHLGNTKAIVCTTGFICVYQGTSAYKRITTGEGDTFREGKRTRVSCAECGGTMSASYLRHHMKRSHRIFLPQNKWIDSGGGGPDTYRVQFMWVLM